MIHIRKVRPLYTGILVTADTFDRDMYERGLIIARKGDLKLWQTVVATGSSVRDIKAGDKVMVSFANYAHRKYDKNSVQNDLDNNPVVEYRLNYVTLDREDGTEQECLLLSDRDVQYVFEGEERDDGAGLIAGRPPVTA